MIERIPPHNEEAEKSVLGAVMLSKDALFDVMEEVRSQDFYNELHKEIFEAISELFKKSGAVDTLTVSEELKKRKSLEMIGGLESPQDLLTWMEKLLVFKSRIL